MPGQSPRVLRTLVRVSLLAAASLLVLACSISFDDDESLPLQVRENAFGWSGHMAPGTTLRVREVRGRIDVAPSPDDTARVVARVEWRKGNIDRALSITGTSDSTGALICAVWGSGQCDGDSYDVNLKLWGRSKRSTDAKVFFTVQVPTGVKLDLVTIDGSILASTTAPVEARVINGDVTVATAVGPVRAKTMNGSVDIRMSSLVGTDSVIAETMNGSAFAYLPEALDAIVSAHAMNGSFSTDFALPATTVTSEREHGKGFEGTLGTGARHVRIRSMNGEVALLRLDAQGRAKQ